MLHDNFRKELAACICVGDCDTDLTETDVQERHLDSCFRVGLAGCLYICHLVHSCERSVYRCKRCRVKVCRCHGDSDRSEVDCPVCSLDNFRVCSAVCRRCARCSLCRCVVLAYLRIVEGPHIEVLRLERSIVDLRSLRCLLISGGNTY